MKKAYVKPTMVKMEVEVQSFMAASKGCVFIPKNDSKVCIGANKPSAGGFDLTVSRLEDGCKRILTQSGLAGETTVTVYETSGNRYKVCKKR